MSRLLIAGCLLLVGLTGCATLEEAYYVDREYGKASQDTWDRQIAHPDLRYSGNLPRGVDGKSAEQALQHLRPSPPPAVAPTPGILILQ